MKVSLKDKKIKITKQKRFRLKQTIANTAS